MDDPLENFEKHRKTKRMTWLDDETEILVQSYAEEVAHTPIKGAYRGLDSYGNITKKMQVFGYNRTAEQVRTKIKQLRRDYYAAMRGSETDRQDCFLFEELDDVFRNESVASRKGKTRFSKHTLELKAKHQLDEDETQQSSDTSAYVTIESPHDKHENSDIRRNVYTLKKDMDDYEHDPLVIPKRPRLITHEQGFIDGSQLNLVQFVSEQLDKQREHQKEITKTFTDAMTAQFTQFSNLITNLTQQMYAQTNQKQHSVMETIVDPIENGEVIESSTVPSYFRTGLNHD